MPASNLSLNSACPVIVQLEHKLGHYTLHSGEHGSRPHAPCAPRALIPELRSEHHYLSALFAQSHLHCSAFSRGVELYQSMKTLGASNANRYHSYRP